jgi:hypothetical protein
MSSRKHRFSHPYEFSQVASDIEDEEETESSAVLQAFQEENYEDSIPRSLSWNYCLYRKKTSSNSFVVIVVSIVLLLILTVITAIIIFKSKGQPPSPIKPEFPRLTFTPVSTATGETSAYTFTILQIADIHLGEAPGTVWGPLQDIKTWRALNTILSYTRPNFIIFSGDQITANDIKDNATTYYKMLGVFIESYHIPWGIIFGNHDDAHYQNTATTSKRRSDLLQFLQQQKYNYCMTRQDSSPLNVFGVSNYALNVTLIVENNTDAIAAQIMLLDSGGGTLPNQLLQSQLDWISSIRVKDTPAVVFQHIPTSQHIFHDGKSSKCIGSNGDGGIDPISSDPGIVEFLLNDGAVHLLAVGHNHGNSYCCSTTTNGNQTLPLSLCFGRHSGYGGYGEFDRGSRIYELRINRTTIPVDEKKDFSFRSWILMESGNVTEEYTP